MDGQKSLLGLGFWDPNCDSRKWASRRSRTKGGEVQFLASATPVSNSRVTLKCNGEFIYASPPLPMSSRGEENTPPGLGVSAASVRPTLFVCRSIGRTECRVAWLAQTCNLFRKF